MRWSAPSVEVDGVIRTRTKEAEQIKCSNYDCVVTVDLRHTAHHWEGYTTATRSLKDSSTAADQIPRNAFPCAGGEMSLDLQFKTEVEADSGAKLTAHHREMFKTCSSARRCKQPEMREVRGVACLTSVNPEIRSSRCCPTRTIYIPFLVTSVGS